MMPSDVEVRKWLQRCMISGWTAEGTRIPFGGMLVMGNTPWQSGFFPRTECVNAVGVSFAAEIVWAAVVHNTLRKIYMVRDETKGGIAGAPYWLLCSRFMTGILISTADCGTVAFGATSNSDSSSESSESLSESWKVVPSQPHVRWTRQ